MADDDGQLDPGLEFIPDPPWTLQNGTVDDGGASFFDGDGGNGALCDFGWDMLPDDDAAALAHCTGGRLIDFDGDGFSNWRVDLDDDRRRCDQSATPGAIQTVVGDNSREGDDASAPVLPSPSSSSAEDPTERSAGSVGNMPGPPKKGKKKGRQRIQQPRFAFITKSDVDQLEDGYRWRKYGQKAVKDSPFPRSYYRCTNGKCTVKKRVERSGHDPATVITTYEGHHCHPTAAFPRSSAPAFPQPPPPYASPIPLPSPTPLRRPFLPDDHYDEATTAASAASRPPSTASHHHRIQTVTDGGLFRDILLHPDLRR